MSARLKRILPDICAWLMIIFGSLLFIVFSVATITFAFPGSNSEGFARLMSIIAALCTSIVAVLLIRQGVRLRKRAGKTALSSFPKQTEAASVQPDKPAPSPSTHRESAPAPAHGVFNLRYAVSDSEIIHHWSPAERANFSFALECRVKNGACQLFFGRTDEREPATAAKWETPDPKLACDKTYFYSFFRYIIEKTGLDEENGRNIALRVQEFFLTAPKEAAEETRGPRAPLEERIRHGYEKPGQSPAGSSTWNLNAFQIRLFEPGLLPGDRDNHDLIVADVRDNTPYYVFIKYHTFEDGRKTRLCDVKEEISWAEVNALARASKHREAWKFTEASKDTWYPSRNLGKLSVTGTENSRTVTWQESLSLRLEVICTQREDRYELTYGGDHGPNDRTGFGQTVLLDPEVYRSEAAFTAFARRKFERGAKDIWIFIKNCEIKRIKAERNVVDPPSQMWGLGQPNYPYAQYIVLKSDGRPPHEYEQESLIKYEGHWFLHSEAAWRGGQSHSDGASNDTYLPDVTDENVDQYIRKYQKEHP